MNRLKQRFTLRKNKRYKNLVSVGLGFIVLSGLAIATDNQAHANEVEKAPVTQTTATNNNEAQPVATKYAVESQSKATQKSGDLDVTVEKAELVKAVDEARKEGLKVIKEADKTHVANSQPEANKKADEIARDYTTQVENINKITDKYKREKTTNEEEIAKAEAHNKAVDERNKKGEEASKKAQEQYKIAKAENDKEHEEYKKAKADYDKKLASGEYITDSAIYRKRKEEYDKALENYNKNGGTAARGEALEKEITEEFNRLSGATKTTLPNDGSGHTPLGSVTHLKTSALNGIEFVSGGNNLADPTIVAKSDNNIDLGKVVKTIEWRGEKVEALDGGGISTSLGKFASAYNYNANGTTTQTLLVDTNKWYKIPKIITMMDGSKHDAVVKFEADVSGINSTFDGRQVVLWNQDGAINIVNGTARGAVKAASDGAKTTIKIDSKDNNTKYIFPYVMSDIDFGQYVSGSDTNTRILAVGGGMDSTSTNPQKVGSKESLSGLNGIKSAPNGTILAVTYDNEYSNWVKNNNRALGVARADFGAGANINFKPFVKKVLPPKEPKFLEAPKEPGTVTPPPPFVPEPKIPVPPKIKTAEVTYTLHNLQVKPQIKKEVKNSENTNLHNSTVPKLTDIKFPLNIEKFPAGREYTKVLEITDSLPTGFEIDLEKTKENANKFYTVDYNKDTHTIKYVGNDNLLTLLNENTKQSAKAPTVEVFGKLLNDNATYLNNFTLKVNNKYTVYSNTVKVETPAPPTPTKENRNEEGVRIDDKVMLPNSINYYTKTWDFDQYKNIKVSKDVIEKGFYYIEDYPEEAVDPLVEKSEVTEKSSGKAVKGVSKVLVNSQEKASEDIKEALKSSNIRPNGKFIVYKADNPEEFFKDYVYKGTPLKVLSPMKVKELFSGEYINKAYQIEFGNGYATEEVENSVPKITPEKDVVETIASKDKSIHNQEITLGTIFNYELTGGLLPKNRAEEIKRYAFDDDYDEKGDEYNGEYKVLSTVEITLKDGTILEKGTDLTKQTSQVIYFEDGRVKIDFDKEFLAKIDTDSEFQAQIFLEMKRIAVGEFENKFTNIINDYEAVSNVVKTRTPAPPKPQGKVLPKTSATQETNTNGLTGVLAGILSLAFLKTRKKVK